MRGLPPRGEQALARLLRRFDDAARELNPYLLVTAIGLAVLYLTCVLAIIDTTALTITRNPGHAAPASQAATAPAADSR